MARAGRSVSAAKTAASTRNPAPISLATARRYVAGGLAWSACRMPAPRSAYFALPQPSEGPTGMTKVAS